MFNCFLKKSAIFSILSGLLTLPAANAEDNAALQRQIEAQQRTMLQQQNNINMLQQELAGVRGDLEQLRHQLNSRNAAPAQQIPPQGYNQQLQGYNQPPQGYAQIPPQGYAPQQNMPDYSVPVFDGNAVGQQQSYPPQGAQLPQQQGYANAPVQNTGNIPAQYPVTPMGNSALQQHQQMMQNPQNQQQSAQTKPVAKPNAVPPADAAAQNAYNAAYAFIQSNNLPAAESAFKQYVTVYDNNSLTPNAWYWCGQTQYQQGKLEEARVSFLNVVRFTDSGKRPDSLLKLGMIHNRLNNKEKAAGYFKLVQANYPNDPAAALAAQQLSQL